MPVVFLCHHCRSRLKVGRKKIGTEVACPRCREPLLVPAAESGSADAMAAPDPPRTAGDLFPEFAVFDEPLPPPPPLPPTPSPAAPSVKPRDARRGRDAAPAPSSSNGGSSQDLLKAPPPLGGKRANDRRDEQTHERGPKDAKAPPPKPKAPPPKPVEKTGASESPQPSPAAATKPARRPQRPQTALGMVKRTDQPSSYSDVLLIRRRTLYFQALLICLMAGAGLAGGLLVGRGLGPVQRPTPHVEPDVQVAGTLTYRNARGEETPDFGAVVIALPAEIPANKQGAIAAAGLSPQSRREDGRIAEMALEELGGKYERTDGAGNFTLKLPKVGQYRLLFISRGAQRPAAQPISAAQLKEMQRYFASPSELIGGSRFAWTLRDVRDPRLAVIHVF